MPIPDNLRPMLKQREFWARFFWDESAAEVKYDGSITMEFARVGSHALKFHLSREYLGVTLSLIHPAAPEGQQLAWDDQAHWHPHVLRWEELDLISRASAFLEPELTHPGLTILLLCRFAPICLNASADVVQPLLWEAWRSLGILRDEDIQRHMEFVDHRQDGFCWMEGPRGWTIDNEQGGPDVAPVYSLRNRDTRNSPSSQWLGTWSCWNSVWGHPRGSPLLASRRNCACDTRSTSTCQNRSDGRTGELKSPGRWTRP